MEIPLVYSIFNRYLKSKESNLKESNKDCHHYILFKGILR